MMADAGGRLDVADDGAACGAVDEAMNDQALEDVGVEVRLEVEVGARPVRLPLVRERGRTPVLFVVITPVRRGMGHGGPDAVVLVNLFGATTREWVMWWLDRPHPPVRRDELRSVLRCA